MLGVGQKKIEIEILCQYDNDQARDDPNYRKHSQEEL